MMDTQAELDRGSARTAETPEERRRRRDEERALILASQKGDLDAFGELVKRYEKKVYWIALSLVGDAEDAADLGQEAFLRVFKAIGRFKLQYNFYTWLYRIVVNLSIDQLRKKGKQQSVSLDDFPGDVTAFGGPERDAQNSELKRRIARTLDVLPPKYKTVLVLRDVHGMSCEDIGKIIQCTNATTRWRLHKARELFRDRWDASARAVR
jgi:RNA polymerase sigma-70 factor (ECF subfamily)